MVPNHAALTQQEVDVGWGNCSAEEKAQTQHRALQLAAVPGRRCFRPQLARAAVLGRWAAVGPTAVRRERIRFDSEGR